jgi:hypothetical protein
MMRRSCRRRALRCCAVAVETLSADDLFPAGRIIGAPHLHFFTRRLAAKTMSPIFVKKNVREGINQPRRESSPRRANVAR